MKASPPRLLLAAVVAGFTSLTAFAPSAPGQESAGWSAVRQWDSRQDGYPECRRWGWQTGFYRDGQGGYGDEGQWNYGQWGCGQRGNGPWGYGRWGSRRVVYVPTCFYRTDGQIIAYNYKPVFLWSGNRQGNLLAGEWMMSGRREVFPAPRVGHTREISR